MRPIGFSTGALALGDFRRALHILDGHSVPVIELSALREQEVESLMGALVKLDLSAFDYVSVHAPSRLIKMQEKRAAALLEPCIERKIPIVLHPDAIKDLSCWERFESLLCLENMDNRKSTGRTTAELEPFFSALPKARFCFDIAHARQVDPTMTEARAMLTHFSSRLAQVHVSEIDAVGHHETLSVAAVSSIRRISHLLPENLPIILESVVGEDEIEHELRMAQRALGALL